MRSKLGIVAQAIGVAALAAIVYLAFLSPDDSGPLTGIDVQPPLEAPSGRHVDKRKSEPKRERPRRVPVSRAPSTTPIITSVETEPITDTPAASQYAGTAARILDAVGRTGR